MPSTYQSIIHSKLNTDRITKGDCMQYLLYYIFSCLARVTCRKLKYNGVWKKVQRGRQNGTHSPLFLGQFPTTLWSQIDNTMAV